MVKKRDEEKPCPDSGQKTLRDVIRDVTIISRNAFGSWYLNDGTLRLSCHLQDQNWSRKRNQ